MPLTRRSKTGLLAVLIAGLAAAGPAAARDLDIDLTEREGQVVAALAAASYAAVPTAYNALLFLERTEQPGLTFRSGRIGGGRVVPGTDGLYLEGFVSAQDYEPEFAFENAPEAGDREVRWRSLFATVGVGWRFDLAPGWSVRPVANAAFGRIGSNAEVPTGDEAVGEVDFIAGEAITAGGYGASVSLEYRLREPDREIDFNFRSTALRMVPLFVDRGSGEYVDAATTAALFRYRRPFERWQVRDRPVRQVFEATYARYHGEQGDLLDVPWLARIGTGLEFETGLTGRFAPPRARVMLRYVFGEDFGGVGVGAGLVF